MIHPEFSGMWRLGDGTEQNALIKSAHCKAKSYKHTGRIKFIWNPCNLMHEFLIGEEWWTACCKIKTKKIIPVRILPRPRQPGTARTCWSEWIHGLGWAPQSWAGKRGEIMMSDVEVIEMAPESQSCPGECWRDRSRVDGCKGWEQHPALEHTAQQGLAFPASQLSDMPDTDFSLKLPYFQNSWVRTFPSLFFSYSIWILWEH